MTATHQRVTFPVSNVQPATEPLPETSYKEAVSALLRDTGGPLESWSQSTQALVEVPHYALGVHPFLLTVNTAYNQHRPLVLSPDMIWLLILQGLALHINANPEKMRHHFVAHEGKLLLEVRRDFFVKGFVGNDWEGVFTEFSTGIRKHIGEKTHSLIVQNFSTTGIVEKAAMEVALMDAMQSYFVFAMKTLCGIPSITLEGTTEDWEYVRDGAKRLEAFDLKWWIPHLMPFLDQCVDASRGQVDQTIWRNFFKQDASSGGPYIRGHIVNLFPYLGLQRPSKEQLVEDTEFYLRHSEYDKYTEAEIQAQIVAFRESLDSYEDTSDSLQRNPYLGKSDQDEEIFLSEFEGMTTSMVASTLSVVPFIWNYYHTIYPMEFIAGFVGSAQDSETFALRPEIGWAVRNTTS